MDLRIKLKNAVSSSSFSKLQEKEKKEGFSESPKSKLKKLENTFFQFRSKKQLEKNFK